MARLYDRKGRGPCPSKNLKGCTLESTQRLWSPRRRSAGISNHSGTYAWVSFLRGCDSLEHDAEFFFVLNFLGDFAVANHDRTMPLLMKKHGLKRPHLKRWAENQ